ncbi:MAG: alpha-amylase family glycosyl hydrolase, partial [Actinomycetes bacterium]
MADFGYDVSDYVDVDPLFGTLAQFDRLVSSAHQLGLKVIVDWVPNHSSDQHSWFVDSRSSRSAAHRDWYWWRDGRGDADGGTGPPGSAGRLPNNWLSAFPTPGGRTLPPAWTWDERTGQWYLHLFLAAQPDLNWENPEVRAAMAETLRFWMARGVSGFRVDVAHGLGKDPALPDTDQQPVSGFNDQAATHGILAGLRQVVDDWPDDPPRMMVGEVYLPTTAQVATYYGSPERPELHLSFNFPPLFAAWDAAVWTERIREVEELIVARGHWPTWVLSNHDQPRHRTRYGSEARARAAAVLLLTLRGTPFVYAGEELGLEDAVVPPDRQVDPGGRDGCRAPLPWDDSPAHGWSAAQDPWLPWPPCVGTGRTVTALRADPASILHLYRRLLALRASSTALRGGSLALVAAGPDVVAYRR